MEISTVSINNIKENELPKLKKFVGRNLLFKIESVGAQLFNIIIIPKTKEDLSNARRIKNIRILGQLEDTKGRRERVYGKDN